MSEEIHEQIFQVSEPASLDLNNIRGTVQIVPQESELETRAIIVKAVKDLDSGDGELTLIEMAQREDGQVIVKTRFDGLELPGLQKLKRRPCNVDYTVQVPKNSRIQVETVSSSIDLRNLEGEFEISSVSGDIDLRDLVGDLKAQSVSGQIQSTAIRGRIDYENVSGDIHLMDSEIPSLQANTVSGEIIVQSNGQTDAYKFHSVSGDLTLVLTENQGISVEMQSLSGKLNLHHPEGVTRQPAPRDLSVQGGGPKVRFETISGDLHLTTPELFQVENDEASEPAPNQHEVLASVARGELSAEEGLQALKGSLPE